MGNNQADDTGLWTRSLQGEGEAFGLLFDRHRDRVFRHAARLGPDRHAVEDIVATAFLELWRCRDRVRLVEGSVLPWLLVTTGNVARNARRSTFRYRKLLKGLPRSEGGRDALDEVLARHPLDAVEGELAVALRGLATKDRQLVVLVVLEGYTLAAAGSILGLTPSAAKTRMHRARAKLKSEVTTPGRPAAGTVNGVKP